MFQIRLEAHWARYRHGYQLLFYSILALGLYLGVRSAPLPHVMRLGVSDALYHAGGLFVCTVLSYVAYPRWYEWARGALMFALGVAVEYAQNFQPERTADMWEIAANGFGVALALLLIWAWQRRCERVGMRR